MRVNEFDYELPSELIAQRPSKIRDLSRLLVLDRASGKMEHRNFRDIIDYLRPNDLLVMNDTRVIPARLFGRKKTGARIEVLLLSEIKKGSCECLVKPGKRLKVGSKVLFGKGQLKAEVIEKKESGIQILRFYGSKNFSKALNKLGKIPFPPYISAGQNLGKRYQTVYSKVEGATAAPTAGLHFTEALLNKLREKGVKTAHITLHTGFSTFNPVRTEEVEDHVMYYENYSISKQTARLINDTKKNGGRIVAVGTTSVRALESAVQGKRVRCGKSSTNLFIYPGYKFSIVDALITNFHFPRSTLLMLVCAFAGKERVLNAYKEAIKLKYRFYSFGDAMLIL